MIEGIPNGWELVRIGQVFHQEDYINAQGEIERWRGRYPSLKKGYVIVQKAVKPKQYRPFANAAEFEPHRDRWVCRKSNPDACMRIDGYGNKGITIQGHAHDFYELFEERTFDDGTPFGIEVTE